MGSPVQLCTGAANCRSNSSILGFRAREQRIVHKQNLGKVRSDNQEVAAKLKRIEAERRATPRQRKSRTELEADSLRAAAAAAAAERDALRHDNDTLRGMWQRRRCSSAEGVWARRNKAGGWCRGCSYRRRRLGRVPGAAGGSTCRKGPCREGGRGSCTVDARAERSCREGRSHLKDLGCRGQQTTRGKRRSAGGGAAIIAANRDATQRARK